MTVIERKPPCMVECFGGPCGRRKGHDGHHATIAAHHLDEKDDLRKQLEGAVAIIRALVDANYLPDDPDVTSDVAPLLSAEQAETLRRILNGGQPAALPSPRTDAPTRVVGTGDATTKSASELSSGQPKETT